MKLIKQHIFSIMFRYTLVEHVWRLLGFVVISKGCARFSPNLQSLHISTGRNRSSLRLHIAQSPRRRFSTHYGNALPTLLATISFSKIERRIIETSAANFSVASISPQPSIEFSCSTATPVHFSHT